MRMQLKYVYADPDRHGNERHYFWRGRSHKKIRMKQPVGTPAFMTEYDALLNGAAVKTPPATVAAGTFEWLCRAYYNSGEYAQLAQSSKDTRRRVLDGICRARGDALVRDLEPRHVRDLRDAKADLPGAANQIVKVLRSLFKWAVDAGKAETNPTLTVPKLKYRSDGFRPWAIEDVEAFEKRHPRGSMARLALYIFLYLGVRRSDAVLLGRQMVVNGAIRFRQAKTGKWLTLPILPKLREEIALSGGEMTFLITEKTTPFKSAASFGMWFRKRCDEAGLSHCSAHGLRKAGATLAAENGATDYEMQAIFGWASAKEAAPYTRTANQERLASAGIHKLERR